MFFQKISCKIGIKHRESNCSVKVYTARRYGCSIWRLVDIINDFLSVFQRFGSKQKIPLCRIHPLGCINRVLNIINITGNCSNITGLHFYLRNQISFYLSGYRIKILPSNSRQNIIGHNGQFAIIFHVYGYRGFVHIILHRRQLNHLFTLRNLRLQFNYGIRQYIIEKGNPVDQVLPREGNRETFQATTCDIF